MYKNHKMIGMLLLGLMFAPMLAQGKDQPANLQPLEEIPPPTISNEADPDEPEITIIKKKGETIEEYRVGGQLYMMKVTPSHGVPYYLYKEDQEGGWTNIGPNPPLSVPKWTIFRF